MADWSTILNSVLSRRSIIDPFATLHSLTQLVMLSLDIVSLAWSLQILC